MKRLLLAVVLVVGSQGVVAAGPFYTGNTVLEWCNAFVNAIEPTKSGGCLGYVAGIAGANETFVGWGYMQPLWCIPEGVDAGQLARVAVKFMEDHPESLHVTASSLVANAFGVAFPCE